MFAGLPPADLESIAKICTVKGLDKGVYLFHEGDPAQGFYVVQSGAINVHRVSPSGKEQVIHVFRAGDSFAEVSVASEEGYPADARALEASQVLLIQKAGILALLKRQPELALRMLGAVSSHLRVLVSQLEDLTMKDVETRLANWLLQHCPDPDGDQPVTFRLSVSKRVLASELGTVSETFSRTLGKFRQARLVLVRGDVITVLSPVELKALLRQHLGG